MVDGLERRIAGGLALLARAILGAGAEELQIVFEDVLDAQKYVLEAGLTHQRSQGFPVIGDGRGHPLDEVLQVVQPGLDDRPAERLKTVDVEGDVVIDHEKCLGSVLAGVADVGQDPVERIGMEVAPTHSDDRAEAAIEGTATRGLDHVDWLAQHGVALEHARATFGKAYVAVVKSVHRPLRIVPPITGWLAVRQSADGFKCPAVLQSAYQLAKGHFAFAADDEIHPGSGCHIGIRRQARIVASNHDSYVGPERADKLDDLERSPALEGHHGEPEDLRLPFRYDFLDSRADTALRQNQVGHRHAMMWVEIAGQRAQPAVGHAYRHHGHVLER